MSLFKRSLRAFLRFLLPVFTTIAGKQISALVLIASALMFSLPATMHAQFRGSISGTVTDTSGKVIPNADVTLTNNNSGEERRTKSNGSGLYQFGELPAGGYTVGVSAEGFKAQTYTNVLVSAELPRSLDAKLEIGAAAETVTVNGDQTPILDTSDANVASTIGSAEVTRLPAFGRDPYEILRAGVGIAGDAARSGAGGAVALPNNTSQNQSNYGIFQTENQIQISSAGQRVTSNTYEIDGVTVDSLLHGGATIITPSIEAVDQITTFSSNYDASQGRNVGAHILTVTKAGTNTLHGSASFQYDEPGLNAYQSYGGPTSTSGVFAPAVRNELKQREWAASLGGPIVKNKLFGFASYEGAKSRLQSFSENYVPTPQVVQCPGNCEANGARGGDDYDAQRARGRALHFAW